ncbi:hypothetical protein DEU38_117136 [Rhodococcus sp. AG1013]|nr:hypothetical protein DEU38_117136 [Rhodococcus sp. AG1013]
MFFNAIAGTGFLSLTAGDTVHFEWEQATDQDG